ncbi:hypothetical protein Pla8534_21900 [Lignipirellula cremea]|uniref:Tetratricopeptide repeat protein n=2 Tax=Lignipirellula cremea TaxID=2528010 RepID=A0A518DRD0_9BACT|nr:hypothetical protein Pla8534_21900 [Lignipirellula cremea]
MLEKVVLLLEQSDSFAAMDLVESLDEPEESGLAYSNLVRDLYGKRKDVAGMLLIGRAGIRYCLDRAAEADDGNPEFAGKMRSQAKTIAFNVSVNAWPGWNEGAVVTRSDSLTALDTARFHLRLTRELKHEPDKLGNAYWLIGAHHLALGQHAAAVEQFEYAIAKFNAADKPDYAQMVLGYQGMAEQAQPALADQGAKRLAAAQAALREMKTEDAAFFAKQLQEVSDYFAARRAKAENTSARP